MRTGIRAVHAATALLLVVLMTACGTTPRDEEPPPDESTPSGTRESAEPSGTESPTEESGEPGEQPTYPAEVDAAIADLAGRLDTETAEVTVEAFEEVTWPDGSLGCPQPGQFYSQALVDGSRLILLVDGTEYAYHAGRDGELSYCADPAEPVGGPAAS